MERPTKDAMLLALRQAGVEVSATASIAQIRTLYSNAIGHEFAENTSEDSTDTESAAPTSEEAAINATSSTNTCVTSSANTYVTSSANVQVTPSASTYANTYVTASTHAYAMPSVQTCALPAVQNQATSTIPTYVTTSVAPAVHPPYDHLLPGEPSSIIISEIDAELAYLRKQREIITLRQELGASHQVNSPVRIDISAIESMVCKFTGDGKYDVRKWVRDLEDAFAVLNFDERAKLISCRRLLDGTAKVLLRTVTISNYNELKEALLCEFGHNYTLQDVYSQLKAHRRKPTDSLRRYVLEMQEIALQAPVPESELIDFIIQGIGDTSAAISMLYSATTVKELKTLLDRYERHCSKIISARAYAANASISQASNLTLPPATKLAATYVPRANAVKSTATAAANVTPPRCFNCSKYGHYQTACPQPQRAAGSCFRCGEITHVYRDCPKRPKPLVATTESDVNYAADVIDSLEALQMP